MKASYKRLKVVLASKIHKLDLSFLASKFGEFLFYDNFFSNLAKFWDLNNFFVFSSTNFLIDLLLLLMPPTLLAKNILLAIRIKFLNKLLIKIDKT